jgi:lipid-A-disaccharide synthase
MTHICLIAGEPSGDFLGGRLMGALKAQRPHIIFSGVGGPQMTARGIESLFPYEQLAVMGIAEVLPKIPLLLSRIRQTVDYIIEMRPDVVVTIDSPDFGFRVAKTVRKKMKNPPKVIHYVAPTVWAWRPERAARVAQFLDGLICLFDFEPPYFEVHGLRAEAVGHPMAEGDALQASGAYFREEYGITSGETIVGALFGSRRGELTKTAPVIRDALIQLGQRLSVPPHIVAPTLPHLKSQVTALLKDYPGTLHVTTEPKLKYHAFKSMDVAMAVSGTVGLELAFLQVPHVIAYRMNSLTWEMVKRKVKVCYAHLGNIMADKEIVPEFIQENCRADKIAEEAFSILLRPEEQKAAMTDITERIGYGQQKTPSDKAADFILSLIK